MRKACGGILILALSFTSLALAVDADALLEPDLELAPQVPLAATLTFRPLVEVDSDRMFLGNVAACTGMQQICDEAYAIDLGPSPEPGRTVSWQADRARALLRKEWPHADIRVAGAKVVKVTAAAATLGEERVLTALKGQLSEPFGPEDAFTISVDRVNVPSGLRLRPGDYNIEFPDLTPEHLSDANWLLRNLSGNQRLSILCRQEGSDEGSLTFSFSAHLSVHALMPVTARALRKGEELNAADLTTADVLVSRAGVPYVMSATELTGRRLRHAVLAGLPLVTSDVELPRVVRRGQMVTLKVNEGEVALTGQVKMLADGVAGQLVEAQYPATKKKLRVRVVDASTVQYVF